MTPVNKKLKVSHFPQVPCKPFEVEVKDEYEANMIVNLLADQHLFLYENNFIPDYCNAITVSMLEEGHEDDEDNGWVDYWNEEEMMEWDEFSNTYLKEIV